MLWLYYYEVKEFKEVMEVKAKCLILGQAISPMGLIGPMRLIWLTWPICLIRPIRLIGLIRPIWLIPNLQQCTWL